MSLRVNNNIAAMNTYRNLSATNNDMAKSLEKLSSGFRINRAADDAAGLAISENLRSQVNGLKVAQRNAQDAISVVQTAEGALNEVHTILQRMRDLAVQYNNGALDSTSKGYIADEFKTLSDEVKRIGESTKFNGTALFSTTSAQFSKDFQVGAAATDTITVKVEVALHSTASSVSTVLASKATGTPTVLAADTVTSVDAQVEKVSTARAKLGALQNRLESTISSIGVSVENLAASESRVRDTDMAQEMTRFTRTQILSQAGTAMLAQANQTTSGVLQLLRG